VTAQAKEAKAVADHIKRVQAQWFACLTDAGAAIAEYEDRGQDSRGRCPRHMRRAWRGRPAKTTRHQLRRASA